MAGNWDRYLAYIHPASHLSLLCISHHILIRKVSRSALEYTKNMPLEEKKQRPVSYSVSFDYRRGIRSYSMYHTAMNFSTWWQWMSFQERMISILVPNWQLVEKTEELRFCCTHQQVWNCIWRMSQSSCPTWRIRWNQACVHSLSPKPWEITGPEGHLSIATWQK